MRLLFRHQWRLALRNLTGIAIAVIAIALGVMSIVTVHKVSVAIRTTVAPDLFGAYDDAIVGVSGAGPLTTDDYFKLRATWRSGAWPDVVGMVPMIEGDVELGGEVVNLIGFEPLADFQLDGVASDGAAELGETSLLVTDHVLVPERLLAPLMDVDYRLGGIPVTVDLIPTGDSIVADLYTAQRILGRDEAVDSIWIRTRHPVAGALLLLDRILPGIAAFVTFELALDGVQVVDRNALNPLARFADAIVFNMGALGAVSLLVAAFLVFQTAVSRIARQEQDRERFEMMGVPGRWVAGLQFLEIGILATAAAAIGLVAGVLLADALIRGVGVGAVAGDGWMVAKAAVAGPGVALSASLLATRSGQTRGRRFTSVVVVVAAVVALVAGGLLFGFVALLLLCFVQIATVTPLAAHGVHRLARVAPGLSMRMTLRALTSRIDEVHLAVGALSVAVATAMGMGLMVESLRSDFLDVLEDRLWPGVYVREAQPGDLAVIHGVAGATFSNVDIREYGDAEITLVGHGRAELTVAHWDVAEAARYGLEFSPDELGSVFVSESVELLYGIRVGDELALRQGDTQLSLRVGHVFRDFGSPLPRVIMSRSQHEQSSFRVDWKQISIRDVGESANLARAVQRALPHVTVSDHEQIRAVALDVFDRTFALSEALTIVALTVAVVGLVGALNVLQMARRREFSLLHAMGYDRRSIVALAWWQSVVLGGMATIGAIPLGIVIGWVLCEVVNPAAFGWSVGLRFESFALVSPIVLGLLGSAVAGIAPAYRVAR